MATTTTRTGTYSWGEAICASIIAGPLGFLGLLILMNAYMTSETPADMYLGILTGLSCISIAAATVDILTYRSKYFGSIALVVGTFSLLEVCGTAINQASLASDASVWWPTLYSFLFH